MERHKGKNRAEISTTGSTRTMPGTARRASRRPHLPTVTGLHELRQRHRKVDEEVKTGDRTRWRCAGSGDR